MCFAQQFYVLGSSCTKIFFVYLLWLVVQVSSLRSCKISCLSFATRSISETLAGTNTAFVDTVQYAETILLILQLLLTMIAIHNNEQYVRLFINNLITTDIFIDCNLTNNVIIIIIIIIIFILFLLQTVIFTQIYNYFSVPCGSREPNCFFYFVVRRKNGKIF